MLAWSKDEVVLGQWRKAAYIGAQIGDFLAIMGHPQSVAEQTLHGGSPGKHADWQVALIAEGDLHHQGFIGQVGSRGGHQFGTQATGQGLGGSQ